MLSNEHTAVVPSVAHTYTSHSINNYYSHSLLTTISLLSLLLQLQHDVVSKCVKKASSYSCIFDEFSELCLLQQIHAASNSDILLCRELAFVYKQFIYFNDVSVL